MTVSTTSDAVIPRESFSGLGAPVRPRDPIEARLIVIWERILNVRPVGATDHWYDIGGDSLGAAVLFTEIDADFHKKLPLAALLEADTVAKLASLIKKPMPSSEAIILNRAGQFPPLYCLHGLHGTGEFARRLAQHLGPEQPVIGFQLARDAGIQSHESISSIASDYLAILRQHQPRGPYRLIGWCVGSMIAVEMAKQLIAAGEDIARLILVDPPARRRTAESRTSAAEEAIRNLNRMNARHDLRQAMIRRVSAISRAARNYELGSYPGELVILFSEESYGQGIETSQWYSAAKRVVAVRVAPTHMSIVGHFLPHLATQVRYLLAPKTHRHAAASPHAGTR